MDNLLFVQIFIGLSFVVLMVILFIETQDYLTYAIVLILIIGLVLVIVPETAAVLTTEAIILSVDWDVIIFLLCLFLIVEILNEKKVFHRVALRIIDRYRNKPRLMFYAICLTSTMIATIIEDLSVAIVFVPIVIHSCKGMKISPVPYLYGVTICINLASTLTPFGSAENIIIANHFGLSLHWHLINLGLYFVVGLFLTIFLIDQFILKRYIIANVIHFCRHFQRVELKFFNNFIDFPHPSEIISLT